MSSRTHPPGTRDKVGYNTGGTRGRCSRVIEELTAPQEVIKEKISCQTPAGSSGSTWDGSGNAMGFSPQQTYQKVLLLVLLLLTVLYMSYTNLKIDVHQLSYYNTEEHPSWKSYIWEHVENLYHNAMAVVYNREDDCKSCTEVDFPVMLTPGTVCKGGAKPEILLLILATAGDVEARRAVRRTWASVTKGNTGNVRHIFLVGNSHDNKSQRLLGKENVVHGDILQNDYTDNYRNLTLKTVAGLRWAAKYCPRVQYVMKVDCDIWLNIPKWHSLLFGPRREKLQKVVFGHCRRHPPVIRTPFHRNGLAIEAYPQSRHPSYCRGGSYAMSKQLADEIAAVSYKQRFFPLEDAYIGHCLRRLGLGVYNPPEITILNLNEVKHQIEQDPCVHNNDFYTVHSVKPSELIQLWQAPCIDMLTDRFTKAP